LLRDLPARARWYILFVIALGAVTFCALVPRATLSPIVPLILFIVLSSLTSALKVQFPIASGSNMSVSYVVDIAALILRGPHTAMIVAAFAGWSQTTFNSRSRNPRYTTPFNMSILLLTAQTAGQVFQRLGGRPDAEPAALIVPLVAMALTYFFANTVPIALAIALTTSQNAWRIWKTDFASSAPSYLLGAAAAAAVIKITEMSGYLLTLLFAAAPLCYLYYKMYRGGRESEERQGAILEAAHDAIITMDQELNIREFNPAAEQMFGYARLHVLGRNVEMLLPAAERAAHLRALNEYQTGGGGRLAGRQIELRGLRADGTEFPLELTVARIGTDHRAELTGFFRDITERRALEEQLRQSQKLEAIGRLAGGVAHDFNNILMSIMGAADLLLMQLAREESARDEAIEIKQSVERGAGLTRQLLAFSRRQATRPRLFALGDVVRGMDTMLRRLIGPEIDFEIVVPAVPLRVVADSGQIEQCVMNLVVNARDAMPEGGRVTVRIDEVDLDEDGAAAFVEGRAGRYARLSVADTGTGMNEATRARLFEPFFTTKEQGKGTGLGLSIVYGIVKQSGGYITVTTEPGRGTTFLIYLPTAVAPEPAPATV
jgi:PAS domain S-box-containing protein